MNANVGLLMNINLGQTIANLINDRDVANIVIRDMVREDKVSEFDLARCQYWQAEYDQASKLLRELGVPVL